MPRFLVQCILVVEADSPDDAHGVVLEEASSERWHPVKDVRTILGVWADRRDPDVLPRVPRRQGHGRSRLGARRRGGLSDDNRQLP